MKWLACQKHKKPNNFKSHNSLIFSLTNTRDLPSNFVSYESFLESNTPNILTVWGTNLVDLINSRNFSVSTYLPRIPEELVCMASKLMFWRDFLLQVTCPCFRLALFIKAITSSSSSVNVYFCVHSFWCCFLFSNIDMVLSIKPFPKSFVFVCLFVLFCFVFHSNILLN